MFILCQACTYVLETHKLPKVEFVTEHAAATVMKVNSAQQLAPLMKTLSETLQS